MDGKSPIRRARLKRLGVIVAIAVVTIAVAIGLVVTMGVIHQRTVAADVAAFSEPTPKAPYYMEVLVRIVALDLDKETMGLQIECIPKPKPGALASAEGRLKLPVVLTLGVSAAGTQQTVTIPSGDTGGIFNVALDLDGNVEEYPGDRHTTSLW
ncbi:MAG: hypothetical protein WCN81_11860, partial [Actinomycetes bacterium]